MTSATIPTTGNACLKQAAATPLKGKLLMPMVHGPALPVSTWTKMKRKIVSSTFRKERLWKSHGTQPGSHKNYKTHVKASSRASIHLNEEHISAPNWSQPAPDKHQNDLQKQGFSAIQEGNTYQPYNVDLRNKVSFDILPTNPQADITATGHCKYWITTIDLMKYQEKSTLSSPDDTMLPEVYTDTVACN